jgi:DNA-binding SARP family transcriptional activator
MEKGGPREAVPLQRGLARILLQAGDRAAAIEAYRGILAVEADSAEDRVALAEIYAATDLERAIAEVGRVLTTDLRHAPAFRLLGQLYERAGDRERATRVLAVLDLLGYSEGDEKTALSKARAAQRMAPRRGQLGDDSRRNLLLLPQLRSAVFEAYQLVRVELAAGTPQPLLGTNPAPLEQHADIDMATRADVAETMKMMGMDCDVLVAADVPGRLVVTEFAKPTVVIDRAMLSRSDSAERRFIFGRAFEIARGGYAGLLRFGSRERGEAIELLKALLLPENERPQVAQEFVHTLPRKTAKSLERLVGMQAGSETEELVGALHQTANRAGILSCDDIAAACRSLARLANEELAVDPNGAVALGAVVGGLDLVRYYLAEDYARLRAALSDESGLTPAPRI